MSQAASPSDTYLNSNLFSGYYLDERVADLDTWNCNEEAQAALSQLQETYNQEGGLLPSYKEEDVLSKWIDEVLNVLGFDSLSETNVTAGRGEIDRTLFASSQDRIDAAHLRQDGDLNGMYSKSVALLEAKKWNTDFSTRFNEGRQYRDASHQIKFYLERTPEDVKWGILTDGRKWRLYGTKDYETQTYYEIDLPELLESGSVEQFKYFYVFFRAAAFEEIGGSTFLDEVWNESETAAQELGEDLQDNVFTALRVLGEGFVEKNDLWIDPDDDAALDELKEQSLVLLYRLMFILYAESRGLIDPDTSRAEDEYRSNFSLEVLRDDILEEIDNARGFDEVYSSYSTTMWSRMEDLFRLIDSGEQELGIPAYNGGLFDHDQHAFLTENEVSNRHLAEVIYRLSTTEADDGSYVPADYADLDTRHLGTIYEGLLEHEFRIAPEEYAAVSEDGGQVWKPATEVTVADAVESVEKGELYVVNDEGERKATGAYYTPDYVVTYIVEETVDPLLEDIEDDLRKEGLEPGTEPYVYAFADRVLELKVLDPAMGSGHFLTKATGYLADAVMQEVRKVEKVAGIFDEQDVRRRVSKECIYGVDLNGMAVELAKLSMWLETLAADQPLAFLDHHLKEGNSLVGSDITEVLSDDAEDNGGQLTLHQAFARVRQSALDHVMDLVQELLSYDNETLADIKSMEALYAEIRNDPLYERLFEIANVHTAEWFGIDVPANSYERMAEAIEDSEAWVEITGEDWFVSSQETANEEMFFHWELEFPEVFFGDDGEKMDNAGFNAVVGNPPYVSNWKLTESQSDLPAILENLYPEATTGHWDLFVPFSYRAATLVANSGYQSFITPNTLATEKYGKNLRRIFINEFNMERLVYFGEHQVFDSVDRQYLIYIMSNYETDRDDECGIYRYDEFNFVHQYSVDPQSFLSYSNNSFRIDITKEDIALKNKVEEECVLLGNLCCVNPGIVAHSASDSPLDFKKDDVISETSEETKRKYVSGRNIDRYQVIWDGKYIDYFTYKDHFHRPKFPELFESDKLMFSRITGSDNVIKCCYDDEGYYSNHIVIHAVPWYPELRNYKSGVDYVIDQEAERYDIRYLSGMINSTLTNYYFTKFLATGTLQGTYSEMNPEDIRKLPIKKVEYTCDSDILNKEYEEIFSSDHNSDYLRTTAYLQSTRCDKSQIAQKYISTLVAQIRSHHKDRNSLNTDLLDYLGNYSRGPSLTKIGFYQPKAQPDSILHQTSIDQEKLRIGTVEITREDSMVTVAVTARFKPENEDAYETDQWGYTETNPLPAFSIMDLTEREADLIEHFVPIAIEEASGFANFRETATKTNSLIDRLKVIELPDVDNVADDLDNYLQTKERAEDLDEKIEKTDQLIDEMVYELYGLTDEEIAIVEETVGNS